MLPHEGAHWEKPYCVVGMACQVACYPTESILMLTKATIVRTLHLLINTQTRTIVGILELFKIITVSL